MNLIKTEKELDLMIEEFPESIIWQQKVVAKEARELFLYAFLSNCGILIYYFIIIKELSFRALFNVDSVTLLEIILTIVFSIFYIIFFYINASNASSMHYSIRPKYISFEWGFFKKRSVDIPFDDITAVNLVGYDDRPYSTIFFGSNEKYKIKKMDFDKAADRVHITFENIKKGQEVYDLLTLLQRKARA
jgi:hypothetical protein